MAGEIASRTRVLCIGNEIMADDALAWRVAERLEEFRIEGVEIVCTSEAGFGLLENVVGVTRLIVVDTIQTSDVPPGTVRELREPDLGAVPAGALHGVGLSDVLKAGRKLELPIPDDIVIFVVEAADVLTVGGEMHPDVRAAIPAVASRIRNRLEGGL